MRRACPDCSRRYDDETCSTVCPHRGIGFCAVCDGVVCLCEPDTCPDMERSSRGVLPQPEAEAPAWKFPDVRKVRRAPAR